MSLRGPPRDPGLFGIPGLSRAALAVGITWVALVAASWWFSQRTGVRVPLCAFRNLTGVPCPGCGGTRCAMALVTGEPAAAFAFNPLVTIFLIAVPLWLIWMIARRDAPRPYWSPRKRKMIGALALLALAANWAYVLSHEPW